MTFYAEASNKKGVEQELARLFLEKAGFTIPSNPYGKNNYSNHLLM